ncbi:MAG: hypothetical protein QMD53_06435 [Actinomycetota bacterium]|nr:hypothetical protein [Actinomycetota bacterium]
MLEIKETNILLSQEEMIELTVICEDQDRDKALSFAKQLYKKLARAQSEQRSTYQRGGHMGPAKLK